jgi:ribosomal protein S12
MRQTTQLFVKDGWVYVTKQVKYVHEDQRLKIIPSIMRIDVTMTDIKAKQTNSAIRKGTRVQLIKNGKKIITFIPNDGCLCYFKQSLIAGFG